MKLVLLRHGESEWNLENRFTGWTDVDLSDNGRKEALSAGKALLDGGYDFDICYTSYLKRAIHTLDAVLDVMDRAWLPANQAQYRDEDKAELPLGESLKDTIARTVPYFENEIAPKMREGKRVIIAAHGNSLRALVMHFEKLTPDEIMKVNLPTGVPLVYEFDDNFNVISKQYLGDPEVIAAKIYKVAAQGKKH